MKLAIAVLLGTTILTNPALAQSGQSSSPDDESGLVDTQEIIVTANKREERIQDVALSVSAVTGKELSERQLLDLQDLQTRIPGLAITTGSSAGTRRIIIRGINTDGNGATVASTLDDVPLSFSNALTFGATFAADFEPYDLARVEVLKGPQGTLYGATAQGGLIKYVTQAPQLDATRAGFEVTASQLSGASAGAAGRSYINLPLTDRLAFRASGYYNYQPGWIGNKLGQNEDANFLRRFGGRFSLLFQPDDSLSLRLSALLQETERGGFDSVEMFGITDPTKPRFTLVDGINFNTNVAQPWTQKAQIYSGTVKYSPGSIALESITSYAKTKNNYVSDNPVFKTIFGQIFGLPDTALVTDTSTPLSKFNQEFRISSSNSDDNSGLKWQAGLFYTNETSSFTNNFVTTSTKTLQPVVTFFGTTPNVGRNFLKSKYEEFAGYATLNYFITPEFDIEAGGRIFHNRQTFSTFSSGAILNLAAPLENGPSNSRETSATFAVAPRLRITPDVIFYGRVASGYRPGGPNILVPPAGPGEPASPSVSFSSDRTVNYEVGLKGSVLDRRITFDVAAFLINWTDVQVAGAFQRSGVSFNATVNGGKARSKGMEWNFTARPADWLTLGWLGAYTDATLNDDIPLLSGRKGVQLPYVPKWTHTLTADLSAPVSDRVTVIGGVDYAFIGKRRSSFNPVPASASIELPSFGQLSARAGVRFDRFSIQLFGKNLNNTLGISGYSDGQLAFGLFPLFATASVIRPREVGLRLSADF
jgi:iron complex outermembrane recepter protein